MKIYTKTGDDGTTGLYGGSRLSKASLRVAAYGDVDEANAAIGMAAALLGNAGMVGLLRGCQEKLFVIGGELASDEEGLKKLAATMADSDVAALEEAIDSHMALLPERFAFVLPGQSRRSAALHVARTVTRRAERTIVALSEQEEINPAIAKYMNRLSDLLFALSRVVDEAI